MILLLVACAGTPSGEGPPSEPQAPALPVDPSEGPPEARWDMVASLVDDLQAPRSPQDGGGRAWIEDGGPARVSTPGRWTLVYEVGDQGVADGGVIFLQSSPFWGWSTPQPVMADAPGYTTVSTEASGVELHPVTLAENLMAVEVEGRAMVAGERVRLVYGDGEVGAVADRFAEGCSPFWFAVDGDGDGIRSIVADSPCVEVLPAPPAGIVAHLPTTAKKGGPVSLDLAFLDSIGNAGFPVEATVRILAPGLDLPATATLTAADRGSVRLTGRALEEGVTTVRVEGPDGMVAESNPLLVSAEAPTVLWGDVHGHSALSDGSGTPEAWYAYARDVAALDFAALTDHDHWGMRFLDAAPDYEAQIEAATEAAHQPGRFVALHGYEWTSWIYGHRHVLYFGAENTIHSTLDASSDTPQELWAKLQGKPAMTIAHHSAGGPIAVDWSIPPDPVLEPLTEVSSVHGQSESLDGPGAIYAPIKGNFVRDALDLGYRFGFVGSGDSHDGHPGLAHLVSGNGGIAAVLDAELSREGLLEAFRDRRVYATNGPRILLFATLDKHRMGSVIPAAEVAAGALTIYVVGTDELDGVDIVRSGEVKAILDASGERQLSATVPLTDLGAGEYVYVRVRQVDGGLAWSSPFYVVSESGAP